MSVRHFLTLNDLSTSEAQAIIARAIELKAEHKSGKINDSFKHKVLAMIFEKSSTRTRVSFEAGMTQMGGSAIFLSPNDTQLGRGEPIEDSSRVLSSMVDIVMIRTFAHDKIVQFANKASVPVINALTDDFHPCQLLADIQTYIEKRGSIQGKTVCWVGDGNNMCQSYINAAKLFDFSLNIACPKGFEPRQDLIENNSRITLSHSCDEAIRDVDLVVTDVWASMGQEEEQQARQKAFLDFQVNCERMDKAKPDALFMHCLPAHREEEVSSELMDDTRCVVWEEAENRLHAQKALMEFLVNESR